MKLDQKIAYLAQHNVDSGAFVNCPIAQHNAPRVASPMGLHSNNVKPPVNGKKAAKAQMGVTGGYVDGSMEPQKANELSQSARKRARRTGKLPAHWR